MTRRPVMLAGFAAALCGDWMLAVRGSPPGSSGFLAGVFFFALAHCLWMAAHLKEARPDWRAFVLVGIPLVLFAGARLAPVLPISTGVGVTVYAAVTALDFAESVAVRRRLYVYGVILLAVSDVFLGMRILHVPGFGVVRGVRMFYVPDFGWIVGATYIAAELCLLSSCFLRHEGRICWGNGRPERIAVWTVFASILFFIAAIFASPGGGYNPFMQMLSALGRRTVKMVTYPLSHYLFMSGMLAAFCGIPRMAAGLGKLPRFAGAVPGAFRWGAVVNAAGLAAIALVPEDVNINVHNAGCWLAAGGGAVMLFSVRGRHSDVAWRVALLVVVGVFGTFLALHAAHIVPFAPWITATQKVLIVSYMAWMVSLTCSAWTRRTVVLASWLGGILAMCAAFCAWRELRPPPVFEPLPERTAAVPVPFTDDERAALRWLDHVTGPLPQDEEDEWWKFKRGEYGVFGTRYNLAFCGYAAAALGMRGDALARAAAGRVLGNCIERYIKYEVWAYSMNRKYWGGMSGVPDPCQRDNVMYTGHLLQLLAFYETLTGDRKYWEKGFDFIWKDGRRCHYTVKRLIDVTVCQMRKGPNGGLCCEPGLMFFPCNNHPHFALALFSRLGHGNWSKDSRRWEDWALTHYPNPVFGGGALDMVYHVWSGLFYSRGLSGLDGWSLLWYEPWARNRGTAVALWRKAAAKIDWEDMETRPDVFTGRETCCSPVDVPPNATMSFLAAAARACDDPVTAKRLELLIDRVLVRRNGMLYLDTPRDWRIGSTANRIISLAEANGFRFRDMLRSSL